MPARPVFSCEFCGVRPDEDTYAALRRQLLDLRSASTWTPTRAAG